MILSLNKKTGNNKRKKDIDKNILKQENKQIRKLIEDWREVMFQTKTFNDYYETFTFDDIKKEVYGFRASLYCPKGLTFKSLEKIQDVIEDNLHCIFIYNKNRFDECMEVKIVKNISKDIKFKPSQTKPYEIYIGNQFDGTPIIVNLNDWCQVLLSGTTGSGKSKLLDCALATQVYNHLPEDLQLFLIQLDKCDLALYEDARICKGFADNLDKAIVVCEYLMTTLDKRNELVRSVKKKGLGSNITDYNRLNPMNAQPTVWVVLDEMASIREKPSDSDEVKYKKKAIDDMLAAIAQHGRSSNVFSINCIQRPTANLLNSFIKSMCNLNISFRQSNSKSSEVATDDANIALGLEKRVAVYKLLSYDFLQTPWVDDPLIMKYIKKMLMPNHSTIFETKWGEQRLKEVKDMMGKKEDRKKSKSNKQDNNNLKESTENLGKENIAIEIDLKKREEELKLYEEKLLKKALTLQKQQDELQKQQELKIKKEQPINDKFSQVDPKIHEINKKNIENIPNFVPYMPLNSNVTVIDKTKYNPKETCKPVKTGKEKI